MRLDEPESLLMVERLVHQVVGVEQAALDGCERGHLNIERAVESSVGQLRSDGRCLSPSERREALGGQAEYLVAAIALSREGRELHCGGLVQQVSNLRVALQ